MTLTPTAQRILIAIFCSVLLAIYMVAWFVPSAGIVSGDAVCLVTARALAAGHGYVADHLPIPVAETRVPPLFPSLLALFTLVSQSMLWLRLLPLIATAGWLLLTRRLLEKLGASPNSAMMIAALTAASPAVISLGTSLVPESLFGLLVAAALIALLDDRALLAGVFAGLATLTLGSGIALIAAGILTLASRRRFRSAIVFTLVAMAIAAPWFGWSLARLMRSGVGAPSNIFTGLHASEKLVVLGRNLVLLPESPWAIMTGHFSLYAGITTVGLMGWSLIRKRQFAPDLFIALYFGVLLCRVAPPDLMVAPILPLLLWLGWRAFRNMKNQEIFAAGVLALLFAPLWGDFNGLLAARRFGQFSASAQRPNDSGQMEKIFAYLRDKTSEDAVVLAVEDAVFYVHTGRKSTQGFKTDDYARFYAPKGPIVTPDALSNALAANGATFVTVAPDRAYPESVSFRKSADALERGGLLESVEIPGLQPEYRLLRITAPH